MGGLFLVVSGIWIAAQVTMGDALGRLGVVDAVLGISPNSSSANTSTGTSLMSLESPTLPPTTAVGSAATDSGLVST